MRFYRADSESLQKRRRTQALFRYIVRKIIRQQRFNRFVSNWYAPPRRLLTNRGVLNTGGGPGYRLAERSFRYNFL